MSSPATRIDQLSSAPSDMRAKPPLLNDPGVGLTFNTSKDQLLLSEVTQDRFPQLTKNPATNAARGVQSSKSMGND